MTITTRELPAEFSRCVAQELDSAMRVISHCLQQLDADQCWSAPAPGMNSIANLLLHLSGNLRQWVVSGLGGVEDSRQRQQEFDTRQGPPAEQLYKQLQQTVEEAKQVLESVGGDELLRVRPVQAFKVSGLQAALESVAHFRGHTQEIVHITRRMAGDKYRFAFVPTPEQGG